MNWPARSSGVCVLCVSCATLTTVLGPSESAFEHAATLLRRGFQCIDVMIELSGLTCELGRWERLYEGMKMAVSAARSATDVTKKQGLLTEKEKSDE